MLVLKEWQDQRADFASHGVQLPAYDVDAAKAAGAEQPVWVHVGGGNLYRTFHAVVADDLLDQGLMDRGVVVADVRSSFTVDEIYRPNNNDILMATMKEDGTLGKRVLASTAKSLFANPQRKADWDQMKAYFASSELQLATYTITEKGYGLKDSQGNLTDAAKADIAAGPEAPKTAMGITAALLLARYDAGAAPIAMVTTDNFSQNGSKFRDSVLTVAKGWAVAGLVPQGFVDYVSDESRVSFPWSMIDRITPNPSIDVEEKLIAEGFTGMDIKANSSGTAFAAFANTEVAHYLVIEDSFPNGRPALDKAGVILTDRKTAERADTMKVTACLNPLHTCLAIYGCLLGYTRIWQEMEDEDLVALIKHLGYDEDLPVVEDPKVIDPKEFIAELLEHRLPNKSLPDAPQRIASDTSQKIPVRYGHTIQAYVAAGKDVASLTYIPLVAAGWLRYLLGVDDEGNEFIPSPDPLLSEMQQHLAGIELGCQDADAVHAAAQPILSNANIFGADLYQIGLGEKVEGMFLEMLAGAGAVRKTIQKYL